MEVSGAIEEISVMQDKNGNDMVKLKVGGRSLRAHSYHDEAVFKAMKDLDLKIGDKVAINYEQSEWSPGKYTNKIISVMRTDVTVEESRVESEFTPANELPDLNKMATGMQIMSECKTAIEGLFTEDKYQSRLDKFINSLFIFVTRGD